MQAFLRALMLSAALLGAATTMAPVARAAEFQSVADRTAVLYDAPSTRAKKLFIASQFYPVEVIVSIENWVKVRDISGDLAWMEKRTLSDKRTVLVKSPVADVRQAGQESAAVVFQAREGVALELSEVGSAGWVKVRHRDGQTGFVRVNQVWGL